MMLTVLRFIPWDNQKAWIGSGAWRMIHPLFDVLRIRTSLYPLGLYTGIPDEPLAPMGDLPTPRVGDEASVTCWSLRRWGLSATSCFSTSARIDRAVTWKPCTSQNYSGIAWVFPCFPERFARSQIPFAGRQFLFSPAVSACSLGGLLLKAPVFVRA